jgi:hypothetical protein
VFAGAHCTHANKVLSPIPALSPELKLKVGRQSIAPNSVLFVDVFYAFWLHLQLISWDFE